MDFNAVCRTCLTTENLNPIFVGSVDEKLYSATSAAIFVTAGIKVAMADGLPQQMCTCCISFSNASLKFRKQCKDAETRLLQVRNVCDGAAEALDSGALDCEDFSDRDMLVEMKTEEDIEADVGDVTVKSEADSEDEDNGSVALHPMEEDPCQLEPAGGAGAAPERAFTRPGEGPRGDTSREQQLELRSCFVRLERFPIEDLRHNLHTCKTCLVTFDYESSLRNHSCTNLAEKSNFNKVCDETAKINFKCDICGKEFVQKSRLITHRAAHNIKRVYDDSNTKNTKSVSKNKKPFRIQYAEVTVERHKCNVCFKEFSQKQHLIKHARLHGDVVDNMMDKHVCDICKKPFQQLSQLSAHIRAHIREKQFSSDAKSPYSCNLCDKKFLETSSLAFHMKVHQGKKLFGIKHFMDKRGLTRHIRIHTEEKPFSCSVCNEQFALKTNLFSHVNRKHTYGYLQWT